MPQTKLPSFPPHGPWDARLKGAACTQLTPIETVHQNDWFAVQNRGGYFTVEYHDSHVAVLPIVEGQGIVMIRAKRPVMNDCTLELPAGAIEPGELPSVGAIRELREETGILLDQSDRLNPMPPLCISSTRFPKLNYVFQVELSQSEYDNRLPHDDEVTEVLCVPFAKIPEMMASGAIYVTLPLAVIGTYLLNQLTHFNLPNKDL